MAVASLVSLGGCSGGEEAGSRDGTPVDVLPNKGNGGAASSQDDDCVARQKAYIDSLIPDKTASLREQVRAVSQDPSFPAHMPYCSGSRQAF